MEFDSPIFAFAAGCLILALLAFFLDGDAKLTRWCVVTGAVLVVIGTVLQTLAPLP